MILGGGGIESAFRNDIWRAFRVNEYILPRDIVKDIGPNSIDVRLGPNLLIPLTAGTVDPRKANDISYKRHNLNDVEYILRPRSFILGSLDLRYNCTARFLDNYWVPMYDGRSTMGRLGICSHITAGKGDYGFAGTFTLEIYNFAPYEIILFNGLRIGQILFHSTVQPMMYAGAYSDNRCNEPHAPELGEARV